MKMKLMAAAAVATLAAATGASAHTPGWYAAADVGYHWPSDVRGVSSAPPGTATWQFRAEDDWLAFGRLGYGFGPGAHPTVRLELEGGYRPNDINRVFSKNAATVPFGLCPVGVTRTAAAPACNDLNGDLKVRTAMANLIFEMMPESRVRPFIGAGIGAAWAHMRVAGQLANTPAGSRAYQDLAIDDDEREFAYQGILGVAFDLSDKLTLDVTGRYLRSATYSFGSRTTAASPVGPGAITNLGDFNGRYKDASLTVGLRYSFGAAPLPPPPPPPPPRHGTASSATTSSASGSGGG